MIGRYERGECRPTSDVLRKLAAVLEVSTDFLVEGSTEEAAKDHIHDRELMRQFKQVQDLDHHDKDVIKTLIDAFLAKRQIQKIVK